LVMPPFPDAMLKTTPPKKYKPKLGMHQVPMNIL
jgi:hypothetical protein